MTCINTNNLKLNVAQHISNVGIHLKKKIITIHHVYIHTS